MKIKLKGFIHKDRYTGEFTFYQTDMSKYGDLLVGPIEREIDYDTPEGWNPVAAEVAGIEKRMDMLAAEYQAKLAPLKNRLQDLQCIEYAEQQ